MKNLGISKFNQIIIFLLAVFFVYLLIGGRAACKETKTFSIGSIDPKFEISNKEVKTILLDAANRWNEDSQKTLLKYDENSPLKVNLIYDDRQADLDKLTQMTENSKENKEKIEKDENRIDSIYQIYKADLKKYNDQVAYWNAKGGAPQDIYNSLLIVRNELQSRRAYIEKILENLNLQIDNFNQNVSEINNEVKGTSNKIVTQGVYMPTQNVINIYTFGNADELRLVAMHELGHALGLDHVDNEKSIMYYLLGNQDLSNPSLSQEDLKATNSLCSIVSKPLYFRFMPLVSKIF